MIRGLFKIFIVVLLLYAIDYMLTGLYHQNTVDLQAYSFVLQELNFCKGGRYVIGDDSVKCVHSDLTIVYSCEYGFCEKDYQYVK